MHVYEMCAFACDNMSFLPYMAFCNPSPQVWNPCMYNRSEGVGVLSNSGATNVIEGEYRAAGSSVEDYVTGDLIGGSGVSSNAVRVDRNHPYISVATMLVPSLDRMMGVAGLDMCDGRRWKRHVRVCGELFSTGYRTNITMRPNTLQDRNCSFGYFDFHLIPPPRPTLDRDDCPERRQPPGGRPTLPPGVTLPTRLPPGSRSTPPPNITLPPEVSPPPRLPPANSCLCQPKCKCKLLPIFENSGGKLCVR